MAALHFSLQCTQWNKTNETHRPNQLWHNWNSLWGINDQRCTLLTCWVCALMLTAVNLNRCCELSPAHGKTARRASAANKKENSRARDSTLIAHVNLLQVSETTSNTASLTNDNLINCAVELFGFYYQIKRCYLKANLFYKKTPLKVNGKLRNLEIKLKRPSSGQPCVHVAMKGRGLGLRLRTKSEALYKLRVVLWTCNSYWKIWLLVHLMHVMFWVCVHAYHFILKQNIIFDKAQGDC